MISVLERIHKEESPKNERKKELALILMHQKNLMKRKRSYFFSVIRR